MDFNPNFKQFKEVNVYRLVLVISCQRWISKVLTDLNFLHLVPNFIFLQSIILFACCLIIVLFTKKDSLVTVVSVFCCLASCPVQVTSHSLKTLRPNCPEADN